MSLFAILAQMATLPSHNAYHRQGLSTKQLTATHDSYSPDFPLNFFACQWSRRRIDGGGTRIGSMDIMAGVSIEGRERLVSVQLQLMAVVLRC